MSQTVDKCQIVGTPHDHDADGRCPFACPRCGHRKAARGERTKCQCRYAVLMYGPEPPEPPPPESERRISLRSQQGAFFLVPRK